jgi:hypothetical protein
MSGWKLSVLALVLAAGSAAFAGLLLAQEEDKSDLLWWLILLPVLLVPLPVLVPRQIVRVSCAVGMTGWCFITGFSIGSFFLPTLIAMWAAVMAPDGIPRERPA